MEREAAFRWYKYNINTEGGKIETRKGSDREFTVRDKRIGKQTPFLFRKVFFEKQGKNPAAAETGWLDLHHYLMFSENRRHYARSPCVQF